MAGKETRLQIAGIVKDFLYNSLYAPGAPLILLHKTENANLLSIRLNAATKLPQAMAKIEQVIRLNNPAYPVELKFVDQDFEALFKTETLTGRLAAVFASLAIVISCLGLFGLAAYTAEKRIREIGIRKVLGASVAGLASLLSRDFLGLSYLIAFPVAWYALRRWLETYAYRTNLSVWVFLAAGILAMGIALVTISSQAIRAALTNPAKSLKSQ